MRLPATVMLPHVQLPAELLSRDSHDAGFVAVNDNDFTARRIENVALGGSQLYAALRDTEPLRDPRAGLHSVERQQIAARIEAKRAALAEAKGQKGDRAAGSSGSGASSGTAVALPMGSAPDPARRRKAGSGGSVLPGLRGLGGSATTVRSGPVASEPPKNGVDKLNLAGSKPGETPPNRTNMTTGSSPGNPGELSGAKVLDWGGPEKKPAKPAEKSPEK
jgi:hypothetical protein